MPRRTPNIYPVTLANGQRRYRVMLSFRDENTGARKQKMVTFKTEREAKDALADNRAEAARGNDAPPPNATVADLVRDFLASEANQVADLTYASYEKTLRLHVLPRLGTCKLGSLTPRRIERHYADLRASGVGPRALQHVHQRLLQIMRYARRQHMLRVNPVEEVPAPRMEPRTYTIWTDAQIARVERLTDQSQYGPIWLVALHTGMRRGELLGLRWADVDEAAGELHIRQQITRQGGPNVARRPKTGKTRKVSVGPAVFSALRAHRAQQNERRLALGSRWRDSDLVFTAAWGGPIGQSPLKADLDRIIALAGVPPLRIHDIRHTHASQLLRHGKHVKEVAERLGHSRASITHDVYAHAIPDQHKQTALDIEAWIARAAADQHTG